MQFKGTSGLGLRLLTLTRRVSFPVFLTTHHSNKSSNWNKKSIHNTLIKTDCSCRIRLRLKRQKFASRNKTKKRRSSKFRSERTTTARHRMTVTAQPQRRVTGDTMRDRCSLCVCVPGSLPAWDFVTTRSAHFRQARVSVQLGARDSRARRRLRYIM